MAEESETIYSFEVEDIDGSRLDLADLKDYAKAILIVNVASQCGYTDQNYRELQALYSRLQSRGLEILAFPSNEFGGQEPGDEEAICSFVESYDVSFRMMSKVNVLGPQAHPLFAFLTEKSGEGPIKWNFGKFLCDSEGRLVRRYKPGDSPLSIEPDIVALL